MALKLKYTDEHGILHINMSPSTTPTTPTAAELKRDPSIESKTDLNYPQFDTINNRFAQYDLFGGKYDMESGDGGSGGDDGRIETRSLFRSRYNSVEEELANTPYAFATERSLRNPLIDITIKSRDALIDNISPSKDIEDDRFFNRSVNFQYDDGLFGPQLDYLSKNSVKTSDEDEPPAFTVTQLIHAQDRYFDLSSKQSSSLTVLSDKINVDNLKNNNSESIKTKSVTDKTKSVTDKIKSVTEKPKSVTEKSDLNKNTVKKLTSQFEIRSAPSSGKQGRTLKHVRVGSVPKSEIVKNNEAFRVLSAEKVVKAVQEVELTPAIQ